MKKLFAGLILSLAAVAAMAMPRPSDIENALAAHDIQSAKAMTQEVLRDHPDNARAHLFNAYVLAKEGNAVAANEELKNVNRLDKQRDPGRSIRDSALYGRTVAEMERSPARGSYVVKKEAYPAQYAPIQTFQPAQQVQQEPSALSTLLKWMFYLTILGLIIYALRAFWKSRPSYVEYVPSGETYSTHHVDTYTPAARTSQRASVAPVYQPSPVYQTAPAPSTVVVNSGNHTDGLVTGMLLNEALHSHHHHGHNAYNDNYGRQYLAPERDYVAPTPAYEAPRNTDYETSRSSYSSGSDDSWTSSSSSGSSSSSSDSWSSSDSGSSYDSSSSSSSWG